MKSFLAICLYLLISLSVLAQDIIVTKIAVLGCHNQGRPAPSITYFADSLKPDYSLWVGDNVYADTESDPQHILRQLQILEKKPGYEKLRETSKFMVTWDDHDFGLNDSDKNYIFKEESKQIHRKFWNLENKIPSNRDGIYYAQIEKLPNGKIIQFLMIDARFNKDEPGPKADILGENQWKWLEEQLRKPADLRFFLSGIQVLLHKPTHWEAWIRQGKSRKRLDALLRLTEAENVLFVTGDQHYVEILKSPTGMRYKTFEIMAAGINKTERPGIPMNRVMKADRTLHSAPIIEVHWTDNPYIHFKNYDVAYDKINSEFKFTLNEIGWEK